MFKQYPFATAVEVDSALQSTQEAFNAWKDSAMAERVALLQRIAQGLRKNAAALADMMALEMGKPVTQGLAEVEKSARLCEWYGENGPAMLAPEPTLVENDKAWVNYLPLGPVLSVMPWNFPIWQVLRGAVPIILAGNSYLLKPAPNVMGSAYLLRDVVTQAGSPAGLFEVYNADNDAVADSIKDPRIAAITLTGSVRAGAAVAAMAGAALKK